jgi:hypothetical protein
MSPYLSAGRGRQSLKALSVNQVPMSDRYFCKATFQPCLRCGELFSTSINIHFKRQFFGEPHLNDGLPNDENYERSSFNR